MKKQRFSNAVSKEVTTWLQQGRSLGKNANLKGQMQHIAKVYHTVYPEGDTHDPITRAHFDTLVEMLKAEDWMVHTEYEISRKVRVISDGQNSFAVCSAALASVSTKTVSLLNR
nr:DUF2913 family protein [Enterovibrio nigricans]